MQFNLRLDLKLILPPMSWSRGRGAAILLLAALAPGAVQAQQAAEPLRGNRLGQAVACGDFDGDGSLELALAAPRTGPDAGPRAGVVSVFRRTPAGFALVTSLGPSALVANLEVSEFGAALAVGDFNGDGLDDLAIGAPGQSGAGPQAAGSVFLFQGSAQGLQPVRVISSREAGLRGSPAGDAFGSALAAGDFNGDGVTDLAIGAPGEAAQNGMQGSGAVAILRGRRSGGAGFGDRLLERSQDFDQELRMFGSNEAGDLFGSALSAADFDGDGLTDLAVGAPGEAPAGDPAASGFVFVFRGARAGLAPDRGLEQQQGQSMNRFPFLNQAGDRFGSSLASGDFDGDGRQDLAVGAPGQIGNDGSPEAGFVFVFRGTERGLEADRGLEQRLVGGTRSGSGDRFGDSLAVGDFDADRRDDLAVGAPGAVARGDSVRSGLVFLFEGAASGLIGDRVVAQVQRRAAAAGPGDEFGLALAVADTDGDGREDLVIGAPGLPQGGRAEGSVFVFGSDGALHERIDEPRSAAPPGG